jgi:hypothetical protein
MKPKSALGGRGVREARVYTISNRMPLTVPFDAAIDFGVISATGLTIRIAIVASQYGRPREKLPDRFDCR